MNRLIRYRLLTIVVLGVLISAVSVFALVQLLTTNTTQRIERAHDAVVDEVDRLAKSPSQITEPTPTGIVAMRAGWMTPSSSNTELPAAFLEPVKSAVMEARSQNKRVTIEVPLTASPAAPEGGTMIVSAKPVVDPHASNLPPDAIVFGAYIVKPMASLRLWQRIIAALTALMILLVATAAYSIITANRGADALRASLAALATDLHAPVARPALRELDAIADGISELARKLADARVKEEQLAQKLAHEGRLAALGRVAAGVAHEVRNPLASIKLRLDLAVASSTSSKTPLSESTMSAITHATSEIERLDRLVADLLVVAGRATGPKGNSDLGKLVRERVEALSPWAKERDVTLEASGDAMAIIDTDAMARAIDNLLRNAVEASAAGKSVNAFVSNEGTRALVLVEDKGPGVASDRKSELFEPFFTTKPAGTGLGLAISRAIAQAHGGDVVYERVDTNKTTRFTLSLNAATTTTTRAAA